MALGSMQRGGKIAVLVMAAALVAGACGSRLPEDVLARIDAGQGASGRTASASGEVDAGTGDETAVAGESVAGADTGEGSTGTGSGSGAARVGSGSGSGAGSGSGSGSAAACRGGNTDKGVTATEIKVGTMVTASGPLPGATEGQYRGTTAYFAKINAAGGICGRKITVIKGDDGLDGARCKAEFRRIEPQVVAFVGSLAVADSGCVEEIKATGVPWLGTVVDPDGRGLPSVIPHSKLAISSGPFVYYRQKYPDVKKVGFMYAAVGGVEENTPASREPIKKVGYEIVQDIGAQIVSPDYTPEIIRMRDAGVQMLYLFAFEINMHVRLAKNMRQQNWEPPLKVSQIGYNSRLTTLLGDVANGWTNHLAYLPVINEDEPAKSPAVAEFVKWNRQLFPNGQIDLFPVNGWRDADLFSAALRKIGADVNRAKIIDTVIKIPEHDGGGVSVSTFPSQGIPTTCFVIARVQNGKWVREHPANGYDCNTGEIVYY